MQKDKIKEIFGRAGIEYFKALPYTEVKTVNTRLLNRLDFEPKSVLVFLVPYYAGECENLSVYSASVDYHIVIRELAGKIIRELGELYPEACFAAFGDHSPIDERAAALGAGLGMVGDNGLIITEKYGSYVFIGDILTDVPPDDIGALSCSSYRECLHCGACRAACPTGILRGESDICLSAVTQKKGELTEYEAELMKRVGTVWGCDECQRVCPYNKACELTPIKAYHEGRITRLTSELLRSMSDEEFEKRAFSWRGRAPLMRNLGIMENDENT